jgi:hypothetical protein
MSPVEKHSTRSSVGLVIFSGTVASIHAPVWLGRAPLKITNPNELRV